MSDIKVERGDWQIENSWESHSNMLIEGIDKRVDVLSSNIPLNLYALCPHLFTVSAIWFKMSLWKIQFNYFSPTNHDFLVLVRTLNVLVLA